MINLILGISLTLNIVCFLGIFLYLKFKIFGAKKMQKELEKYFVSDNELNDMLDKL